MCGDMRKEISFPIWKSVNYTLFTLLTELLTWKSAENRAFHRYFVDC